MHLFGLKHLYEPCFYSDKYGTMLQELIFCSCNQTLIRQQCKLCMSCAKRDLQCYSQLLMLLHLNKMHSKFLNNKTKLNGHTSVIIQNFSTSKDLLCTLYLALSYVHPYIDMYYIHAYVCLYNETC